MSKKFKIGDVVRLKSSGPKMTVVRVRDEQHSSVAVECMWFLPGGTVQADAFPHEALVAVVESEP